MMKPESRDRMKQRWLHFVLFLLCGTLSYRPIYRYQYPVIQCTWVNYSCPEILKHYASIIAAKIVLIKYWCVSHRNYHAPIALSAILMLCIFVAIQTTVDSNNQMMIIGSPRSRVYCSIIHSADNI